MLKSISASILLLTSLTANAAFILQEGESYSSRFNLTSNGDAISFTDNYWEVVVGVYDGDNAPYAAPVQESTVTLTLFENTDYTSQVFSQTLDTSDWLADYGVLFTSYGYNPLFSDLDGSFKITYNGGKQADLFDITIRNYGGSITPSNIAQVVIFPATSPVPVPAAVWLFGTGLIGLFGVLRRKR